MKCVICRGTDVRLKKVTEMIETGKNIVRVKIDVPVCSACGERYYSRPTIKYLESIKEKLGSKNSSLRQIGKVLEYPDN